MSAPTNGYTVRLVYYGAPNLTKNVKVKDADYSSNDMHEWKDAQYERRPVNPQVTTQNIRIIAFSGNENKESAIAIYELVKNPEGKA